MNLWMVVACLCGADGDAPDVERPLYELRRDVSDVLRREAGAANDASRAQAIHDMVELYEELKRDPRRHTSDSIKEYRTELWSRLTRVKRRLERQFARSTPSRRRAHSGATLQASQSLASHLDLVGHSLGGPLGLLSQTRQSDPPSPGESPSAPSPAVSSPRGAAGGAAGGPDFGPALVQLIERTISPDFWDVNGGPGSIVYFRPLHALVVRASGEIHEDIGGLVDRLR